MIVSGGYLLGRVRTVQQKRRVSALKALHSDFEGYENALSEYRSSAEEYFEKLGESGQKICAAEPISGLTTEDMQRLKDLLQRLKKENYFDALELVRQYLSALSASISALEEEVKTAGKALPLVTGAIGFLVAVFLF